MRNEICMYVSDEECVYESLKEPLYHTSSSTHTHTYSLSLFVHFVRAYLCRVFADRQSKNFKDKTRTDGNFPNRLAQVYKPCHAWKIEGKKAHHKYLMASTYIYNTLWCFRQQRKKTKRDRIEKNIKKQYTHTHTIYKQCWHNQQYDEQHTTKRDELNWTNDENATVLSRLCSKVWREKKNNRTRKQVPY